MRRSRVHRQNRVDSARSCRHRFPRDEVSMSRPYPTHVPMSDHAEPQMIAKSVYRGEIVADGHWPAILDKHAFGEGTRVITIDGIDDFARDRTRRFLDGLPRKADHVRSTGRCQSRN